MSGETIGVAGADTMASGIAQPCVPAGRDVTLFGAAPAAVAHGFATMRGSLAGLMDKPRISAADGQAAVSRIHAANAFEQFAPVEVVIQAAHQDFGIKHD